MRNKILITIICVLLVVCLAVSLTSCNKKKTNEQQTTEPITSIVFLGDSICEGVAGPAPLQERVNYSYYGILGQINGIEAHNRSVSGYLTKNLLDYINRDNPDYIAALPDQPIVDEETASLTQTYIRTADVIHISILGNDLLQFDFPIMIMELLAKKLEQPGEDYRTNPVVVAEYKKARFQGDNYKIIPALRDKYDEPKPGYGLDLYNYAVSNARTNIGKIVARLKQLNPNATIIFQNVYNPIDCEAELISQDTAAILKSLDASYDFATEAGVEKVRAITGEMIYGLDSVLNDYTDKIVIADAFHTFDEVYKANKEWGKELIYIDGVHPSDFGHAVLAQMNQELLVSLGLLKMDNVVKNYQNLRIEQLERMYKDSKNADNATFDLNAAKAEISSSNSMEAITYSYFTSTKGYTPKLFSSVLTGRTNGVHYDTNTTYDIDTLYMYTPLARDGESSAIDMLVDLEMNIADLFESLGISATMTFKTDNTFEININIDMQQALANINDILSTFRTDIDTILEGTNGMSLTGPIMSEDLDIVDFVLIYANNMFAGFNQNDFAGSLSLLKNSLGVSISGVDATELNNLIGYIIEHHALPDNMSDIIKSLGNISINVEGIYSMVQCKSYTGTTYNGIYIGQYYENISPFLIATQYVDEDGKSHVRWQIEILGLFADFVKD
ncbi:MAG: SGNH/GDSL hydrolase family protein [Clostridia bacterium]|nr:SGNH/GDSL hydrolase family protein [Clostridia bacterium]